jgi:adenosine deaminase
MATKEHPDLLGETSLVLIAHFIKEPESKKERYIKIRHNRLRKTLIKKAIALNSFLTKSSYKNYVKGIDAAASEMDAGPEVFAPIYRYLRKKGVTHFTFHAGEDFRHMASGLRTIYEAVDFLELERGDRLGHCTALGISPSLWMERCGDIFYIPRGEWLDDLVFVWHLIRSSQNEKLQTLILPLESEISELSYRIYGESYPPYLLSVAWKLRKYNPFLYLEKDYSLKSVVDIVDNEEKEEEIRKWFEQEGIKNIMMRYHMPMEPYDMENTHSENSRKQYDEIIAKNIRSLFSVEQLEMLQTIVLEYLSKKGIVIEALPTSNMRISYYKTWEEYHLEPWLDCSPDNGLKPAVVLGTDDPGIFMTNIYNEYACAYLHLEKKGHSPTSRIRKLKDIHTSSTIYKFDDDCR